MKPEYNTMFRPLRFRNGLELKNRMVMAPMGHLGSLPGGNVSDEELAYYDLRVKDVGMVITSAASVKEGTFYSGITGADRDEHIPGLQKLSRTLKAYGAAAILQLAHFGLNGGGEAPSVVAPDHSYLPTPVELTDAEIENIIRKFGEATRRAIEAGFDGVEIHGANSLLIQQFTSAHFNRRTDRWGGSSEKRMAFPLAVIKAIKQVVKESGKPFIIGYRITPEEAHENGLTMADTIRNVDLLADQGLDYIHVSLHNFWSKPRRGTDDTRSRIEIIRDVVGDRAYVIGVGEIKTPDDAARALSSGADLLAIARGLLLDPRWVQKAQDGQEASIKTQLFRSDRSELLFPDGLWDMIENFIPFAD